ncbi:solute carrier family 66 member 3 isoform X1 [Prionailurus viverrinus]|uniref:solute carrier family 66 member 3 isoform X1 n=1 Tax=Prionailurus viverrinus TaxID=61388 RepID=UPI001FF6E80C|nr:solute carrier family 66 member 3 isoform X1 [Prionailurus viverrinus]
MEKLLLLFCNWSTLGVCAALKLPQISAVLAARSARGISLPSLLLELAGFLVFLRYQCYYEYPLLTYLEYPILIAQDVLLLLCAFHFNGNVKGAAPYMAVYPFRCPGIRRDWGVRCFCQICVLVVKLKKIPNAQSKYFHQRGQQVCSAPVPVEDQGLRHRERPHLEPRCIHLCNKNNNNDNDHRRSYDSYTFRDHACFKRVGNHHGPSLQEDGGKG